MTHTEHVYSEKVVMNQMLNHHCCNAYLSAVHILGHVIGFWYVLAIVTFPISFMKQVVHIILLVAASRNIGALDVISRERKKKANN